MNRAAETASVLDEMVLGVMGMKADKAVQLTPVGTETAKALQFGPLESPYPGLREALARIRAGMADLDKYVGAIERDIDAIEAGRAPTTGRVRDELDEAWEKPVEPETFDQRMKRLSDEAKAATFGDAEPEVAESGSEWLCSAHGNEDIRNRTSPRGRKFRACGVPNCKEFERR